MEKVKLQDIGPLQLLAVVFHKPALKGTVRNELQKLRDQKLIRIVDGIVIQRTKSGEVVALEQSDLTAEENMLYGAVIGGLLGLGTGDTNVASATSEYVAEEFNKRYEYGLDQEDLQDLAEAIPSGDAALVLLIEHQWLIPLRNAMRNAGGSLVAQDFLSPELLFSLGKTVQTA
jgi:uncharacterized membrane protein